MKAFLILYVRWKSDQNVCSCIFKKYYMKFSWRNRVYLYRKDYFSDDSLHEHLIKKYINNTLSVCLALLFKD